MEGFIDSYIFPNIFIVIIYIVVIAVVVQAYLDAKKRSHALKAFALKHQFHSLGPTTYVKDSKLGLIFQLGRNGFFQERFTGTVHNYRAWMYIYSYKIGSGKSSKHLRQTVFELDAGSRMPHIFIDSRATGQGVSPVVSEVLRKSDRITIGGDFESDFTFYAQQGLEQEALELFTPDVLENIKLYSKDFDIELIANSVFIYSTKVGLMLDDYEKMYQAVSLVLNALERNLKDFEMPQLPTKPGVNLDEPRQLTRLKFGQKLLYKHEFIITLIIGLSVSIGIAYLLILLRNR